MLGVRHLKAAELLEAADGYVPLIQSVVWILFLIVVGLLFRKQVTGVFVSLKKRIESGSELKIAGLEVGKLVTKTSDLPDEVKTFGDPDQLKLLFKAQGKGWKKSTKAMEVPNGCIVQVTTERQSADGDWANAEAVVFVPDVRLESSDENAFKIVRQ